LGWAVYTYSYTEREKDCLLAGGRVGVGLSVGGGEGLATVWKQKKLDNILVVI